MYFKKKFKNKATKLLNINLESVRNAVQAVFL